MGLIRRVHKELLQPNSCNKTNNSTHKAAPGRLSWWSPWLQLQLRSWAQGYEFKPQAGFHTGHGAYPPPKKREIGINISPRRHQMANEPMKRCLPSLVTREMQVKPQRVITVHPQGRPWFKNGKPQMLVKTGRNRQADPEILMETQRTPNNQNKL